MRLPKIHSHGKFDVYNEALLAIATMLYMRFTAFLCLLTKILPLSPHFPTPQALTTTIYFLFLWVQLLFACLDFTYKWYCTVLFCHFISFSVMSSSFIHIVHEWQDFLLFCGWIVFLCVYVWGEHTQQFLYPSIC